jgi:hypothetical protein
MKPELVAPCGMNCNVCSGYLAYSHHLPKKRGKIHHCEGCLPGEKNCAFLKRRCAKIGDRRIRFCFECDGFPCERLETLDARYRKKYGVSLIGNLREIKESGINDFLVRQKKAFKCDRCDGVVSIHNGKCYRCDKIESWKG